MAPYNPPSAHYTQVDVSHIDETNVLKAMGKNGANFKEMTSKLHVKYIWWDKERQVIEIWGPFSSMMSAFNGVNEYMNSYM